MQVAVYHGQGDIRVENRSEQPIDATDAVRIDVEWCGICGSDVHEYTAGPLAVPSDSPHHLTGDALPVTFGHELSGVVSDCGDGVDDFEPGDEVTVNPALWCGECRYCESGAYNRCRYGGSIGLSGGGGGFAETVVVPESMVVKLPDGVSLKAGALVEPYAVALHAIRQSGLSAGDTVAVFGAGPIGLCLTDLAANAGVRELIVSEPRSARRSVARRLGATDVLDPGEADPIRDISAATRGGVDVAFETAGIEATVGQAIRSTLKGGRVTLISVFEESIEFQPNFVMMAERSIVGSIAYQTGPRAADGEFGTVAELLADGELDPDPLITSEISLEDVVDRGFEPLTDADTDEIKVLVSP